jgi:hypothetical protein
MGFSFMLQIHGKTLDLHKKSPAEINQPGF